MQTMRAINESDQEYANRRRWSQWQNLIHARGSRYSDCNLKNFVTTDNPKAREVVDRLIACVDSIDNSKPRYPNIVLYGPKGTGKDHLLVGMCRTAIARDLSVEWRNGVDMFGAVRDAIGDGESEASIVKELSYPDVLYISDPLPPFGQLTEFQSSFLFRVLDRRYSNYKPTWITVNVSSGTELEQRLGSQNADRIKDGALALFCNWPSYRKALS